jgi:hypothetical protein
VVAHTITEEAKQQRLVEAGVGFLDATGAKYLDLPGLYLWTEGRLQAAETLTPKEPQGVRLSGRRGSPPKRC